MLLLWNGSRLFHWTTGMKYSGTANKITTIQSPKQYSLSIQENGRLSELSLGCSCLLTGWVISSWSQWTRTEGLWKLSHACKTKISKLSLTSVSIFMRTMKQGIWKQDFSGIPEWWPPMQVIKPFSVRTNRSGHQRISMRLSTLLPKLQSIPSWSPKSSTASSPLLSHLQASFPIPFSHQQPSSFVCGKPHNEALSSDTLCRRAYHSRIKSFSLSISLINIFIPSQNHELWSYAGRGQKPSHAMYKLTKLGKLVPDLNNQFPHLKNGNSGCP